MKTDTRFGGSANIPQRISIFEVGPRDGLQNEPGEIALSSKIELVNRLAQAGLRRIETGSFVSPRWVPQMADSEQVFAQIMRQPEVRYSALTPNLQGLQRAQQAQVSEVAVFAAASEAFSQKNINCSLQESVARFAAVCEAASAAGLPVRGYISCTMGCPYSGDVPVENVSWMLQELLALGCYEVSIGDTTGVGTPLQVQSVIAACLEHARPDQLAVHFHDTYGQALANIFAALQLGIATVDSSVAGLGGCPYAKGASGNVATDDLVYMLHGMGVETGVDLDSLLQVSHWICRQLQRPNNSRVALARASDVADEGANNE